LLLPCICHICAVVAPRDPGAALRDLQIRFCTTKDGVGIAYSAIGQGPFIVRVLRHFPTDRDVVTRAAGAITRFLGARRAAS
jgi:hypothetical protein